jgi:hypothetical protein
LLAKMIYGRGLDSLKDRGSIWLMRFKRSSEGVNRLGWRL